MLRICADAGWKIVRLCSETKRERWIWETCRREKMRIRCITLLRGPLGFRSGITKCRDLNAALLLLANRQCLKMCRLYNDKILLITLSRRMLGKRSELHGKRFLLLIWRTLVQPILYKLVKILKVKILIFTISIGYIFNLLLRLAISFYNKFWHKNL